MPITTNLMEYFPDWTTTSCKESWILSAGTVTPLGRPDRSTTVTAGMTAFDHALIRGCKPDKPFLLMESTPAW